jgi:hypothetical protein
VEARPQPWRDVLRGAYQHPMADFIQALRKLKPSDEQTQRAIAEILGLQWQVSLAEPIVTRERKASEPVQEKSETPVSPEPNEPIPKAGRKQPAKHGLPSRLVPKAKAPSPPWIDVPAPLHKPHSGSYFSSYPLMPLFEPKWTRAILSSALASYQRIGPLDLKKIVRHIAQAEPIRELPRNLCPTMARGLQLLVDKGPALEPFYRDQDLLEDDIRNVAGTDRTDVVTFSGSPLWGVTKGDQEEPVAYQPPPAGVPVLLVTDLGITRNIHIDTWAGKREWLTFFSLIQKAGCPIIVFVPYPKQRWPRFLPRTLTILQWDRVTSAMSVNRALRNTVKRTSGQL